MSYEEKPLDPELLQALREEYNAPPETPREEMWGVVQAGLSRRDDAEVVDMASRRALRWNGRVVAGWLAAAAALVVLGVGIGRMTAPTADGSGPAEVASAASDDVPLRTAAVEHLEGTEAFLTLVRSDARSGELDPQVRTMARGLLTQTRLFLDVSEGTDPKLRSLMEDLELVLAQIVTVTDDGARERAELNLALEGLEDREVLTRIRTLSGNGMAGT
jgi:hypothetical protein